MPTMTSAGYVPEKPPVPPKKTREKKKKKKKRRSNAAVIASVLIFVLAVCVGASTLYVYRTVSDHANTFCKGQLLNGIPLAGMTREEGAALLEEQTAETVASWRFDVTCQGRTYALTAEDVGLHIDEQATLDPAWAVGKSGGMWERFMDILQVEREGSNALTVFGYSLEPVDALLEQIREDTECSPVDATVTFVPGNSEPFRFTDDQVGYALDTAELREQIVQALQSMTPDSAEVVPQTLEPDVTRASLERAIVLRARVTLTLSDDEAALNNVKLAAGMLNGRRAAPGEAFSFNELVGARIEESGYVVAQEPAYGIGVAGVGGGICQLSTALYQAALLAGLQIEERHAAVYPQDYCEMGQEATVSEQGLDLVIRNNTDSMAFLTTRLYADDEGQTVLEVQIIGEAQQERYRLESTAVETEVLEDPVYLRDSEGQYATYTDERVPVGEALPGYEVTVELVTVGDDEESREVVSEDTYEPVAPTVYVGVTER